MDEERGRSGGMRDASAEMDWLMKEGPGRDGAALGVVAFSGLQVPMGWVKGKASGGRGGARNVTCRSPR